MFVSKKNIILQKYLKCTVTNIYASFIRLYSNVYTLPKLNISYFCDNDNTEEISKNIIARKGIGDIKRVIELKVKLEGTDLSDKNYKKIQTEFYNEILKIPNNTHPDVAQLGEEPRLVKYIGTRKEFGFKPREFYEITKRLNLIRTDQLGNVCGNRSYYVLSEMAELEQALIKYTINNMRKHKFSIISVPDVLYRNVIEGCGLNTRGTRTQAGGKLMKFSARPTQFEPGQLKLLTGVDFILVHYGIYTLEPKMYGPDLCLSGTSEMALAGHFADQTFSENQLPIKVAAVSRCFRAEVSGVAEEKGIYRVHQFTKVEMFALSSPEKSDEMLEEFRNIEEQHFSQLGLYLRTLDMPPHELGAPAYRKYDIEAWLPGRALFGELSSCSNCTDYQSRRLNIKCKVGNKLRFVHTLNGTACAIPRMLIALTETFQSDKGFIEIPNVLQKYMENKERISRQKKVPELKLMKHKK